MMFGTRETFRYFKCAGCECLQIEEIPRDLMRHYPSNYRCWAAPTSERTSNPFRRLRRSLAWRVVDHQLGIQTMTARVAYRLALERHKLPPWMAQSDLWKGCGLTRKSAILDVGSGSGVNLALLAQLGFDNLLGIDPFLDSAALSSNDRIQIRKADLSDLLKRKVSIMGERRLPARFKLIMFHHSLEHIPDPAQSLATAERLLEPHGWILIRIPLADSLASQIYGVDWVQLDAPRHVCLFTVRTMKMLADRAGFLIEKVVFDSTSFQFWGSEQYRLDIPLEDSRSVFHAPPNGPFTAAEMREWEHRAVYLNQMEQGDQAVFYLRRNTA
jgi:SAM-dependent methyltransferase